MWGAKLIDSNRNGLTDWANRRTTLSLFFCELIPPAPPQTDWVGCSLVWILSTGPGQSESSVSSAPTRTSESGFCLSFPLLLFCFVLFFFLLSAGVCFRLVLVWLIKCLLLKKTRFVVLCASGSFAKRLKRCIGYNRRGRESAQTSQTVGDGHKAISDFQEINYTKKNSSADIINNGGKKWNSFVVVHRIWSKESWIVRRAIVFLLFVAASRKRE